MNAKLRAIARFFQILFLVSGGALLAIGWLSFGMWLTDRYPGPGAVAFIVVPAIIGIAAIIYFSYED